MMKDKEKIEMDYMRANVFMKRGDKIHISKRSGVFYNGYITEVSNHFFFLDDVKNGRKLIFFGELNKPIEEFRLVEK